MAALVAVLGVASVGLMNLGLAIRDPATATATGGRPAAEVVPRVWVEVLSVYQSGRVIEWTVDQFWVQLARLGGDQKNPKKRPPGRITLWRGW